MILGRTFRRFIKCETSKDKVLFSLTDIEAEETDVELGDTSQHETHFKPTELLSASRKQRACHADAHARLPRR